MPACHHCSHDCCIQCPWWPTPLLETSGNSQASLAQSLVGSLLLSPGSWCTQAFVCALQESVSQSCGSSIIKSYWPSELNSLGGSQSLCQIPELGNLLCVLEVFQQCKNFFGIVVLQFVGHLLGGSMVGLMVTSFRRVMPYQGPLHPEPLTLQESTADPYPTGDTQTQFCLSLCGVSGSWCAQVFFEPYKGPRSLQMVTAVMKLKDAYSLEGKLWPT